jgi:hypothetical protein
MWTALWRGDGCRSTAAPEGDVAFELGEFIGGERDFSKEGHSPAVIEATVSADQDVVDAYLDDWFHDGPEDDRKIFEPISAGARPLWRPVVWA